MAGVINKWILCKIENKKKINFISFKIIIIIKI